VIQLFLGLLSLFNTGFLPQPKLISPITEDLMIVNAQGPKQEIKTKEILASQTIDLAKRDKNSFVNQVFKDNILLALSHLDSFVLQPGEVFAFHDNFLDEYEDKVVKTVGSEFNANEGYRSSGLVVGDGVCHLASLMNWVASESGLAVQAEVDHDFRSIPGVPKIKIYILLTILIFRLNSDLEFTAILWVWR
jgi:vancomycin resistance protein YoaR